MNSRIIGWLTAAMTLTSIIIIAADILHDYPLHQ
jgi:hypothetical protein